MLLFFKNKLWISHHLSYTSLTYSIIHVHAFHALEWTILGISTFCYVLNTKTKIEFLLFISKWALRVYVYFSGILVLSLPLFCDPTRGCLSSPGCVPEVRRVTRVRMDITFISQHDYVTRNCSFILIDLEYISIFVLIAW